MTVRDRDNGAEELLRRMKKVITVRVGILGDIASFKHEGSEETIVEIATKHEFGIDVPQRSFIRETVDINQDKITKITNAAAKMMLDRRRTRFDRIGGWIGVQLVAMMQERISDGIPPPNSPITIEKKQSSTPLIDTGQLRSSISYDVEVK